jgi:large repetitive protein
VTVTDNTIPTFAAIPAICSGTAAPALPATSTNGITGTWSPATISNTSEWHLYLHSECRSVRNSCDLGRDGDRQHRSDLRCDSCDLFRHSCSCTSCYIDERHHGHLVASYYQQYREWHLYLHSECRSVRNDYATLDVTVTNNTVPTFAAIPALCSGTAAPALPATSTNGITGTWSPATISNTTSGTYTFTPSAGQCATATTLDVTVTDNIIPTFAAIPAICSGTAAPALPATSTNGITGTWSPATISNTTSGTYTFTPSAGQCATTTTLDVTVTDNTVPTFAAIPAICSGTAAPRFLQHRRTA